MYLMTCLRCQSVNNEGNIRETAICHQKDVQLEQESLLRRTFLDFEALALRIKLGRELVSGIHGNDIDVDFLVKSFATPPHPGCWV